MFPMLILRAEKISKSYGDQAVFEDFSFELAVGETVGLVGPSGCGKSTCARILAGLERPQSGTVEFRGKDITGMSRPEYGKFRRSVQMIFQDPAGSFNPVRTIGQSMSAVLTLTGVSRADHATVLAGALQQAGLQQEILSRYPDQISGGQAQRAAIVRGLLVSPSVMILDEPTSALDVSVQAQILHLLKEVQREREISYVFISHDAAVVSFMADRVVRL
ncbi:MAG: ABC transporter ATP-binding protein [Methanoculleus thermophilus]|nr:ABC transporter ATP-binding protein [Methanoculleus thermophilus]